MFICSSKTNNIKGCTSALKARLNCKIPHYSPFLTQTKLIPQERKVALQSLTLLMVDRGSGAALVSNTTVPNYPTMTKTGLQSSINAKLKIFNDVQ